MKLCICSFSATSTIELQNLLPSHKLLEKLANSDVTKETLNYIASIAAQSIVGMPLFSSGVLFCDPKSNSHPDLSSYIWPRPAAAGFEVVRSVQPCL